MSEIRKFPYSNYDVTVCNKDDILEELKSDSSIDDDVIKEIIDSLEEDVISFIKKDKWTGIPFLGSIKMPDGIRLNSTEEQKELIKDAFNTMDKDEYVKFRHTLAVDNYLRAKEERNKKYIASMVARRNNKVYNRLIKQKGEKYANFIMLSLLKLKEPIREEEYEQ